ncbi:MAG: hypothetical protein ACM3US_01115 [Sphingomonadaceae bacterium]
MKGYLEKMRKDAEVEGLPPSRFADRAEGRSWRIIPDELFDRALQELEEHRTAEERLRDIEESAEAPEEGSKD